MKNDIQIFLHIYLLVFMLKEIMLL